MIPVLTPFTAQKLVTEGWNKESIRQYINDHTRVSLFRYKAKFMGTSGGKEVPPAVLATLDSNGMLQEPFIDQSVIIVAEGVGEKDELVSMWSPSVSREIKLLRNDGSNASSYLSDNSARRS